MSYNITGTTITLTRGDTFEALVSATKRNGHCNGNQDTVGRWTHHLYGCGLRLINSNTGQWNVG